MKLHENWVLKPACGLTCVQGQGRRSGVVQRVVAGVQCGRERAAAKELAVKLNQQQTPHPIGGKSDGVDVGQWKLHSRPVQQASQGQR